MSVDGPPELGAFTVTLKFSYTPGYSSDTGCRLFYLDHRNKTELKKHVQNATSECTASEIVRKEYERLETFNDVHYGYLQKVGRVKYRYSRMSRYRPFRLTARRTQ
jgi:hypothetical protein